MPEFAENFRSRRGDDVPECINIRKRRSSWPSASTGY